MLAQFNCVTKLLVPVKKALFVFLSAHYKFFFHSRTSCIINNSNNLNFLWIPLKIFIKSKYIFLFSELSDKSCQAILNSGEDDEMTLTGYRRSPFRTACTYLCFVLTVGLLRLFMHWWKHWLLLATHTPCALDIAERLLITEQYEGKHSVYYVKDVITLNSETFK